jgi:putative cardiolipin synthase
MHPGRKAVARRHGGRRPAQHKMRRMDLVLDRRAAWRARLGRGVAAVLVCLLAGCATLHREVPRPPSYAFDNPQQTSLGRGFAAQLAGQPGQSGFRLLPSGQDAFVARAALADAAERSLDLQYHIVAADETGTQLLYRALRAAQRGVRVRLLIDDLDAQGRDADLAVMAAHPNVQVRLFNPSTLRRVPGLLRLFEYLSDGVRLNRRMHNKLWIADNAAALIGGRNLGDAYFSADGDTNFADLDVLAAGAVVADASRSFDAFWNSEWAVPIEALTDAAPTRQQFDQFLAESAERARSFQLGDYAQSLQGTGLRQQIADGRLPLTIASGAVVYDPPAKLAADPDAPTEHIIAQLRDVIDAGRRELIVVSPYFVPSERGVEVICGLQQHGAQVRILTNSLASTDVVAVHAGYARYRQRLLACGAELHELRPSELGPGSVRRLLSSGVSLHAKALVVDGQAVLIGSMNLDPRSRLSNTEVGVLIDSADFGRQLVDWFDAASAPERAFRLELREPGNPASPLVWIGREQGQTVRYDSEPLIRWWQQLAADLLGLLIPESML